MDRAKGERSALDAMDSAGKQINLEFEGQYAFCELVWLSLACSVSSPLAPGISVTVRARGLTPEVQALVEQAYGRWPLEFMDPKVAPATPSAGEEFAFVSGGRSLTVKLVAALRRIHLEPSDRVPDEVDPAVFWTGGGRSGLLPRLQWLIDAIGNARMAAALVEYRRRLVPGVRRVSLLTSVFRGDEYLEGFLENASALRGYESCEHFLIRPGSPGKEHARLLDHVRSCPSAVYINLERDPGLYETWNLGARISTARYLSSANLDDRRAPAHVETLVEQLDQDDTVDVASSALRVTDTPNLSWSASSDCPVWYGGDGDRTYTGDALLRRRGSGYVSHNVPHCMPVWRRCLHMFHGYFDERAHGPSADWAFWLRVGTAGHRFALISRPLGLYLRHPESYWHRSSNRGAEDSWDARIAARYAPALLAGQSPAYMTQPMGLALRTVRRLAECASWIELVTCLADLHERTAGLSIDTPAGKLVDRLTRRYLGLKVTAVPLHGAGATRCALGPLDGLLRWLIEVYHLRFAPGAIHTVFSDRVLTGAATDLHTLSGRPEALLLLALRHRRCGDPDEETQILEAVYRDRGQEFWPAFQTVYRFDAPLEEIVQRLQVMPTSRDALATRKERTALWYFPDFTHNNPYQRLLYERLQSSGGRITPVTDAQELCGLMPIAGYHNVLHIHWIQTFFEGAPPEMFSQRAAIALSMVRSLRARGFSVYWTVHNRVSHATVSERDELEFRQSLALLVDRIYLHHPMIWHQLDWMPRDCRPHFVEHGPFHVGGSGEDRASTRRALELDESAYLLTHVGRVRSYKNLDATLPAIRALLDRNASARFVIAGRMSDADARQLAQVSSAQAVVRKGFLSEEDLYRYVMVADYVLLTYREILTSGTLFYVLSCGRPVIAPRLGTIPAYVVDGWNGFLYSDPEELESVLTWLPYQPDTYRDQLADNARYTASKLEWKFL